jgi:hypothetical protein
MGWSGGSPLSPNPLPDLHCAGRLLPANVNAAQGDPPTVEGLLLPANVNAA